MNERVTLNDEQIAHLFKFVQAKRVRYKDVQVEIVDHLASGIEDMMTDDAQLTFLEGLNEIYSKFPITGFAVMVGERTDAMMKYWRRQYAKILIGYFKLPKIILTIGFFYAFFQLFSRVEVRAVLIFGILAIVTGIMTILVFRDRKKRAKFIDNYLVLESYYQIILGFNVAIFFLGQLFISDYDSFINTPLQIAMFAFLCCYTLFSIDLALFQFPKKLEEELQSKYKHLSFVN